MPRQKVISSTDSVEDNFPIYSKTINISEAPFSALSRNLCKNSIDNSDC